MIQWIFGIFAPQFHWLPLLKEMEIPLITSLFLGFIPMLSFSAVVYWLDRYEKEPIKLLVVVFLWGAIFASASAFIVNTIFGVGIFLISGSEPAASISVSTIIAPIIEEAAKGIAVFGIFVLFRNEFDSILDGIIYGAIVGLGFAATENAYYIFTMGYLNDGWQGIANLAIVRIFMVGWQHPFYTAFIGIGFAISRMSKSTTIKILSIIGGLLAAVFTHSMHNTLFPILTGLNIPHGHLLASQIDWLGWVSMLVFIFFMINREKKILTIYLLDEEKYQTLLPEMFTAAVSKKIQRQLIHQAKSKSLLLSKSLKRYFQLCAELAHKKNQYQKLGNEQQNNEIIMATRNSIIELNDKIKPLLTR